MWRWIFASGTVLYVLSQAARLPPWPTAILEILSGILILLGACEVFLQGVWRLAFRMKWSAYVSATVGAFADCIPELVIILFVARVSPMAAFITALVAVYNNALAFSLYSFFLPKDRKGRFLMPKPMTEVGTEVLIAASAISLVIGLILLALRGETHKVSFHWGDLFVIALVFLIVLGFYIQRLLKYYPEAADAPKAQAHHRGGVWGPLILGTAGFYLGGEAVAKAAEMAVGRLGLGPVPTAVLIALFAGLPEYLVVYKAHRRGEVGVALANVFGGLVETVMLIIPVTFIAIGAMQLSGVLGFFPMHPELPLPINFTTTTLLLLMFPTLFLLFEMIKKDHTLDNLDACAMSGVYLLVIFFLIFYS